MVEVRAQLEGGVWSCQVTVDQGGHRTEHVVTVTGADLERWGHSTGSPRGDVEDLVARSFEFLLRREPASSILRSFDLAVIQRYFPEYDREMRGG
ncbi:MAG TPA: hypothetical protein VN906_05490 [Candidatus Sulfotelmatobacter sp.]|nr:hypothetical protein [Candidatus Sulfotelmatobacter sp.]